MKESSLQKDFSQIQIEKETKRKQNERPAAQTDENGENVRENYLHETDFFPDDRSLARRPETDDEEERKAKRTENEKGLFSMWSRPPPR